MVRKSDFCGALTVWNAYGISGVPGYYRVFFLQERGILKRLAKELQGAFEDLTAALEIDHNNYECLRHRGDVRYLIGDLHGAQDDTQQCLAMSFEQQYSKYPTAFCLGDESVTCMELVLPSRKEQESYQDVVLSSHLEVMKNVRVSDFAGALEIWEAKFRKDLGFPNLLHHLVNT
ncbi:unnamed protein product [Calypogeia fissa]